MANKVAAIRTKDGRVLIGDGMHFKIVEAHGVDPFDVESTGFVVDETFVPSEGQALAISLAMVRDDPTMVEAK